MGKNGVPNLYLQSKCFFWTTQLYFNMPPYQPAPQAPHTKFPRSSLALLPESSHGEWRERLPSCLSWEEGSTSTSSSPSARSDSHESFQVYPLDLSNPSPPLRSLSYLFLSDPFIWTLQQTPKCSPTARPSCPLRSEQALLV